MFNMGSSKTKPYMIVGWKKYFNSSNPIIDKYLSKYGLEFIEQTFRKIQRAHTTKKPYILLIKFRDSDAVSILHQNEYKSALEMMLQFCIRIEYYELCSEIESYIKNMDKRKRRNVKKVVREFATI
jgi:hypothetical protein